MTRDRPSLQLVLELDLTDPIGGSLTGQDGPPLVFSGWLGLHSELERLWSDARAARAADD